MEQKEERSSFSSKTTKTVKVIHQSSSTTGSIDFSREDSPSLTGNTSSITSRKELSQLCQSSSLGNDFDLQPLLSLGSRFTGKESDFEDISTQISKQSEDANFEIKLDVVEYKPENVQVKVLDDMVIITGKQEVKISENNFQSRSFSKKFSIPPGVVPETIKCSLTRDGRLKISAPLQSGPGRSVVHQSQQVTSDVRQQQHQNEESETRVQSTRSVTSTSTVTRSSDNTTESITSGGNIVPRLVQAPQSTGKALPLGSSVEGNTYIIRVEVKNFKAEEIQIKITSSKITIEGKHESEFASRSFFKEFSVQSGVQLDKIQSTITTDGLLTITAPIGKSPQAIQSSQDSEDVNQQQRTRVVQQEQVHQTQTQRVVQKSENLSSITSNLAEENYLITPTVEPSDVDISEAQDVTNEVCHVNDGETIEMKLNVSEYRQEDIQIRVSQKTVTIRAVSKNKSFCKKFNLPDGVKPEGIRSTISPNGVLTITAPVEKPGRPTGGVHPQSQQPARGQPVQRQPNNDVTEVQEQEVQQRVQVQQTQVRKQVQTVVHQTEVQQQEDEIQKSIQHPQQVQPHVPVPSAPSAVPNQPAGTAPTSPSHPQVGAPATGPSQPVGAPISQPQGAVPAAPHSQGAPAPQPQAPAPVTTSGQQSHVETSVQQPQGVVPSTTPGQPLDRAPVGQPQAPAPVTTSGQQFHVGAPVQQPQRVVPSTTPGQPLDQAPVGQPQAPAPVATSGQQSHVGTPVQQPQGVVPSTTPDQPLDRAPVGQPQVPTPVTTSGQQSHVGTPVQQPQGVVPSTTPGQPFHEVPVTQTQAPAPVTTSGQESNVGTPVQQPQGVVPSTTPGQPFHGATVTQPQAPVPATGYGQQSNVGTPVQPPHGSVPVTPTQYPNELTQTATQRPEVSGPVPQPQGVRPKSANEQTEEFQVTQIPQLEGSLPGPQPQGGGPTPPQPLQQGGNQTGTHVPQHVPTSIGHPEPGTAEQPCSARFVPDQQGGAPFTPAGHPQNVSPQYTQVPTQPGNAAVHPQGTPKTAPVPSSVDGSTTKAAPRPLDEPFEVVPVNELPTPVPRIESADTKNNEGPNPVRQVNDGRINKITINVTEYRREDITIRITKTTIVIEGNHDDANGSRSFVKNFPIPAGVKPDQVTCGISPNGVLVITTPAPAQPVDGQAPHSQTENEQAQNQVPGTKPSQPIQPAGQSPSHKQPSQTPKQTDGDDEEEEVPKELSCTVNDDKFELILDVSKYKREEIIVRVSRTTIRIEGKQETKFSSRSFYKEAPVPHGVNSKDIKSVVDANGHLVISAPVGKKPEPKDIPKSKDEQYTQIEVTESKQRTIQIHEQKTTTTTTNQEQRVTSTTNQDQRQTNTTNQDQRQINTTNQDQRQTNTTNQDQRLTDTTNQDQRSTTVNTKIFKVTINVSEYTREEITIIKTRTTIRVEGKSVKKSFFKEVPIPDGVDPESIATDFTPDGMLTLSAPINENVQRQVNKQNINQQQLNQSTTATSQQDVVDTDEGVLLNSVLDLNAAKESIQGGTILDVDKSKTTFTMVYDVSGYKPQEISIRITKYVVSVEGKQVLQFSSKSFYKKFEIPHGVEPTEIKARLTSKGTLTFSAPIDHNKPFTN